MSGNSNNRNKQRFANERGWITNSNQNGRIGLPANLTIGQNIINKRTNTFIKDDNNNITDTKNLVVIQNQLSRVGGPSPISGMFGPSSDSVNYKKS